MNDLLQQNEHSPMSHQRPRTAQSIGIEFVLGVGAEALSWRRYGPLTGSKAGLPEVRTDSYERRTRELARTKPGCLLGIGINAGIESIERLPSIRSSAR